MKSRTVVIVLGLAAVAALAVYLLAAMGRDSAADETVPGSGPGTVPAGTTPARRASPNPSPGVVHPPPDPRKRAPVAAAPDAGAADSIAVPRSPTVKESPQEKLAADARQRQLASLRVELANLKERAVRLTEVLARVKAEGSANALQLQQIQRQLQQSVDAQPRVQAMIEKVEKEQREAEERKKQASPAP